MTRIGATVARWGGPVVALVIALALGAVVATAPPRTPPPLGPLPGTVVVRGDFESGDLGQWKDVQRVADDRIQVVGAPVRQGVFAGRFEVRQGDRYLTYSGNRAEVVAATDEREGDEGWYEWSTLFAADYPNVTGGFQIVTQWHAIDAPGSQPMLVFYVSGSELGFKTVESTADLVSGPSRVHWKTRLKRGAWNDFRLHVKWSHDPSVGFVELWHNGTRVVARTARATLIPGFDAHLKMGLYRSATHTQVGVVYHDGLVATRVG